MKRKRFHLLAPQSGKVLPIGEIADEVFSSKIMGDGVAIVPTSNKIYCPCGGVIVCVAPTLHSIIIETSCGAEILLHFGIDSIVLGGEHYIPHVHTGQRVCAGQLLMEMDIAALVQHGIDTISPCIIINEGRRVEMQLHLPKSGLVVGGKTPIVTYYAL